jgi:hypothetical protein
MLLDSCRIMSCFPEAAHSCLFFCMLTGIVTVRNNPCVREDVVEYMCSDSLPMIHGAASIMLYRLR